MDWPATPEVARAYIDQLLRDKAIDTDTADQIIEKLDQVKMEMEMGGNNRLARQINRFSLSAEGLNADVQTKNRFERLDATLKGISEGLRQ
jgi:hypothetical protein